MGEEADTDGGGTGSWVCCTTVADEVGCSMVFVVAVVTNVVGVVKAEADSQVLFKHFNSERQSLSAPHLPPNPHGELEEHDELDRV